METNEEQISLAELYKQINDGMDDISNGNTKPFSETMDDIRRHRAEML